MSATSLGKEQRDADDLDSKSTVTFSWYEEAQENDAHQPGTCCANCADYIADRNGDTWDACAKVEGYVAVEDWCVVWERVGREII